MSEGWGMGGWGGTLTVGGGGGGGGPVVQNFVPAVGSDIQRNGTLGFDVIFSNSLVAMVIQVVYRDTGAVEVAYNNEGFTINYLMSERSDIVGGQHFDLRRRSGWYLSPSIKVEGGDSAGGRISGAT